MKSKSIFLLLFILTEKSSADCFDEVLPKNTKEVKEKCPSVHEQMMICIPKIADCLTNVQNSRRCYLYFHNCIEEAPSDLAVCETYKKESTDHIRECTESIFEKFKNETLVKALKTLETVLGDVFDRNYSAIAPKRAKSLESFLDFFTPFTNSQDINSDSELREKIIKVDHNRLSEFKIPLKFWHGGFGSNIVSRLIDRALVKTSWDTVNMKYVNHAWAGFADCVESGNKSLCLGTLNSELKKVCLDNSDQLQCGVYIGLVEKKLNETFSTGLFSNEKIYRVISKFKITDFQEAEYVIRENKLPLFHLEYKHFFESCYPVKRTVSSCLLISHYCEQELRLNCMDELHFCFSNITGKKSKCSDSLFVIRESTKAVSNFVDWGRERIWWISWTLILLFVNVVCTWAIKKGADELWKQIKSLWNSCSCCCSCCSSQKKKQEEQQGTELKPLINPPASSDAPTVAVDGEGKKQDSKVTVDMTEQSGNNFNLPVIETEPLLGKDVPSTSSAAPLAETCPNCGH